MAAALLFPYDLNISSQISVGFSYYSRVAKSRKTQRIFKFRNSKEARNSLEKGNFLRFSHGIFPRQACNTRMTGSRNAVERIRNDFETFRRRCLVRARPTTVRHSQFLISSNLPRYLAAYARYNRSR